MVTETTEKYTRLCNAFREAHSQFSAAINLFCCPWDGNVRGDISVVETKSVSQVWDGECKVIGTFTIPILNDNDMEYFERSHPDEFKRRFAGSALMDRDSMRTQQFCVAFVPVPDSTNATLVIEAARKLRELADLAGRELPRSLRNQIPWDFEPREYIGRWLTLMFWQQFPAGRNRRENGVFWGPSS